MKRAGAWLVVGCVGVAAFVLLGDRLAGPAATAAAKKQAKDSTDQAMTTAPPAGQPAGASAPPGGDSAAPEKIVHTFVDEPGMREFAKLWQQRQMTMVRMSVLQAYWNEEQAGLAELDTKLTTTYKVDTTKNYFLDSTRKVLIEREGPPPAESAPAAAAAPK